MHVIVINRQQRLWAMKIERVYHEEQLTKKPSGCRRAMSQDISFCKCVSEHLLCAGHYAKNKAIEIQKQTTLIFWRFLLNERNLTTILEKRILASQKTFKEAPSAWVIASTGLNRQK